MELILSEGTVFGEKYHTVEPSKWMFELEDWCVRTFGCSPANGVWEPHGRWYMNNSKFWFREKKDLEWFIIRWT
jgi:hypothetical protein